MDCICVAQEHKPVARLGGHIAQTSAFSKLIGDGIVRARRRAAQLAALAQVLPELRRREPAARSFSMSLPTLTAASAPATSA